MSELLYGRNVIIAAIACGVPLKALRITESNPDIIRMAQNQKIPYTLVNKAELDKVNPNSQGVTAEINDFPLYGLEAIMKKTNQSLIVALDSLEDPHNLGAILRTCDAAGADGIILPKNRSVRLSSTVAKVSTGAIFSVKCAEVVNLAAALKKLKAAGYWIVGAEAAESSTDYTNVKYNMPTVLVIGSEGRGISRLVLEQCDFIVKIPMRGTVNSLNASVSAGILIYQIKKDQQ